MKISGMIASFLKQAIQSGHFTLPFHYPALTMSKQQNIEVEAAWLLHLQKIINHLSKLGATAQFIPDTEKQKL